MVAHSMDSPNAQDSLSSAFGEFNYKILLHLLTVFFSLFDFDFLQPKPSARR